MVLEEEATVMAAEAAVATTVGSAKAVGEVKAGRWQRRRTYRRQWRRQIRRWTEWWWNAGRQCRRQRRGGGEGGGLGGGGLAEVVKEVAG